MKHHTRKEEMFVVVFEDADGKSYWVDEDGNICKDCQQMTELDARIAVDAFLKTCHPAVREQIEKGWASIEISPAADNGYDIND